MYEDEHVLAFLDIGPLSRGHTLVIPKEAVETLDQLSDEASAAAIGRVLPRLCRAVMAATGCRDYNVLQNNGARAHQAVDHVHFHIIPKPPPGRASGIDVAGARHRSRRRRRPRWGDRGPRCVGEEGREPTPTSAESPRR